MRALLNRVVNRLLTPITADTAEKREPNMNELLLEGARLSGQIEAGLLKACLTQCYINPGETDLEVVYTFPLPYFATITEVSATIGDKQLKGVVKAHTDAEADYEQAIAQGNSAILIEVTGVSIYTANLGNLRPGEKFTVSMHFVQIIDWYNDQARVMFPTTIAPRYGDAQRQGHLPFHADTGTSITAGYGFELDLMVRGEMARAVIESPSHAIKQTASNERGVRIEFADDAFLDRDFVLRLDGLNAPEGEVMIETASDEHFALATFYPPLPNKLVPISDIDPSNHTEPSKPWVHPLRVKLLVDCSGSMRGDSMESARKGIRALFDGLSSRDRIGVARFGSSLEHVMEKPQAADAKTRVALRKWLTGLDANLGGTELESALEGIFKSTPGEEPFDILLITDGEVWDISAIVQRAKQSEHRIFAIGVGSSPGESLLRKLVEETGGAALFVNPNEDMAQAIHRLASMMSGPRVSDIKVSWGCETATTALLSQNLYAGVPFRAAAMFKGPIDRETKDVAILEYRIDNTKHRLESNQLVEVDDLGIRQIVAHACIESVSLEDQGKFSEAHQLLNIHTAWVLVHVRSDGDKAGTLPELSQIPSMHAAGSHGFGQVEMLKQIADHSVHALSASYSQAFSVDTDVSLSRDRSSLRFEMMASQNPSAAFRMERANLKSAYIEPIEIPPFLRRGPSLNDLQMPLKNLERISRSLNQGDDLVRHFSQDLYSLSNSLGDGLKGLQILNEKETEVFNDLWNRARKRTEIYIEPNDPRYLINRLRDQIAALLEPLPKLQKELQMLLHSIEESYSIAREDVRNKEKQLNSTSGGQQILLKELLEGFTNDADLESLWDWVERLRLPGSLSAQLMSLRNEDSLAKGQVIALLIMALLDDDIEPKPNRQQMRALRYVLRELSDERIDTFKRLIWEASEMASA
ncbi:MAG: VWA domain-containing protein [Betaproteobacteria bacterium]|nr:VWA domain-containing protein [Betaproteobacteria bacterium]